MGCVVCKTRVRAFFRSFFLLAHTMMDLPQHRWDLTVRKASYHSRPSFQWVDKALAD